MHGWAGRGFYESFPLLLIYEFQGKSPIGPHSLCRPIGTLSPGIHKSHFSHWWMISGALKTDISRWRHFYLCEKWLVQDLTYTTSVGNVLMQFRIRESQLVPEKTLTIAWCFLQKAGEVEKCSDFGVWSLIPADGAYCCGGSSKVRDVKYTATVDNCVMQLRTCESQLINLKWIDDSLAFRAKNWETMYFRS